MTKSSSPAAKRMRKYRRALKSVKGLVPVTVYVPDETRPVIRACEKALQEGVVPIIPERVRSHEMDQAAFTLETLYEALKEAKAVKKGRFDVSPDPIQPCLRIKMVELGGVESFLSVGGQQVIVSTLIVAANDIEDRASLNEFLLKSNKIFPLSSFSIATIDGVEYYELIGELSVYSSIAHIVEEIETLQDNVELADGLLKKFRKI